ncbi:MAG: GAF domain-containing protein [Syntrophobacteraceae bacterium]|jgi:hypothetical protein
MSIDQLQAGSMNWMMGLLDIVEKALTSESIEQLSEKVLPSIASALNAESMFLYCTASLPGGPILFPYGIPPESVSRMEEQCELISARPPEGPAGLDVENSVDKFTVYPLRDKTGCAGLLGLTQSHNGRAVLPAVWEKILILLTCRLRQLGEWNKTLRQLEYLNTYLTVSSMLSQSVGLHEMLETTLYCCMDISSGTEASVLLLDDEKKNFHFYQIEGLSKQVLMGAAFPADKGIAGSVLQNRQSEIVHNVQNDPRFHGKIDSESGFVTRNMIVVPLLAGEEAVGVLNVLNKADGQDFTEEEHCGLLAIAEEIAFAIRNAKLFEYVVDSYCKQRQGQSSCKGCRRPLGSWTPCVKYREAAI